MKWVINLQTKGIWIFILPRFQVSESINGFLKTQDGVLLLSGSDENEISNEMHLKNTVYNLTRKVNLKGTVYWTKKNHIDFLSVHSIGFFAKKFCQIKVNPSLYAKL